MFTPACARLSPLRRLLSIAPVLALVLTAANAFASVRMVPRSLAPPEAPVVSAAASLSLPDASRLLATTPRELVAMEAAGLVSLARQLPAPMPYPVWQADGPYHAWGDCTDPIARQAAPEMCM